jgi:hypothetical protein
MLFAGEWHRFPDGKVRPAMELRVRGDDGNYRYEKCLLDTGADRTIFSFAFLQKLALPTLPPPGLLLTGLGGSFGYVLLDAEFALYSVEGIEAGATRRFAALTDPTASDHSILGRDILDNFDVIVSWSRKEVWLLASVHYYQILTP